MKNLLCYYIPQSADYKASFHTVLLIQRKVLPVFTNTSYCFSAVQHRSGFLTANGSIFSRSVAYPDENHPLQPAKGIIFP